MQGSENKNRPVYAVLLAAGEARRCRPKKLFLPWGRETVIEKSLSNLLDSRVEETVVVLGHEPAPLQRLLAKRECLLTVNPEYRRGMASTFLTGIREIESVLSPPADAGYLLALSDAPFIDAAIIDRLVEVYRQQSADIVIPVFHGRRGHPSIFHRNLTSGIAASVDAGGVRMILQRYPDRISHVEMETAAVLGDIDTYEEYKKNLEKYGGKLC